MANIAVRHWRFLYKMGMSGCRWFGGSLGNYLSVRKQATVGGISASFGPDSPTVLTIKVLFSEPGLPIGESPMKKGYRYQGVLGTLVKGNGGFVGIHGRSVSEPFGLRIGLIDRPRPEARNSPIAA